MKLLRSTLLLLLLLCTSHNFAQIIQTTLAPNQLPPPPSNWTKKNQLGFDISEIAFVNWSAGGTSSISGLFKGEFGRTYIKGNHKWANELIVKYGLNKQDGTELRKTDDAVMLNSTYGFRKDTISNWYYSAKFNFNTQFTNGYNYPNRDIAISKPFAPAYVFLGAGAENSNKKKNRTFYFSPITLKTTLVLDQDLANQGSFGVKKAIYAPDPMDPNSQIIVENGQKVKAEFGILLTAYMKNEIFKNIFYENRLSLYTDYLNKFGNVDVDYDTRLDLVVNAYVKANIGIHLVYDDDIKTKKDVVDPTTGSTSQVNDGPRAQLRQVLGVGLVYAFQ
ncbi:MULTISPECIES: DUF3078 domain-containing protein [Flavobacterium]|jgi:hypothetical protein|uniref:DUF3078 domain-containing protein n=1 Tax=Flavobacterium piscisymbiosum TaxID=2893753 RepID=A0ABS8ME62_9FLAO|nr:MULTISPECIES: DUF3078 domain-containing protein [unclassified Flavobacterium]MCA1917877.1 DUF3078 domain-containing protein [Flavobacterium piscis]MCC9063020.1 DUF3078 domain-containing protein [Flavobacterium sp. F-30]QDW20015.1 DUF3078 domain-containing protein [Flavobacterium sp. KBS0721]